MFGLFGNSSSPITAEKMKKFTYKKKKVCELQRNFSGTCFQRVRYTFVALQPFTSESDCFSGIRIGLRFVILNVISEIWAG